jgi:hypothetical protein
MKEQELSAIEAKAKRMSRRALLQKASAAAMVGMLGSGSLARAEGEPGSGERPTAAGAGPTDKGKSFPDKFLWGCATAGIRWRATILIAIFGPWNICPTAFSRKLLEMPAITIICMRKILPCWLIWDSTLIGFRLSGRASSRRRDFFRMRSWSITGGC